MNLEKKLAEDKNFALLTQDNSAGVRRLAEPTQNHIPAWGRPPRNFVLQANFGEPPAPPEALNFKICLVHACRRHDSVHAQVFHHLAIMIVAVADDKSGHGQARGFSLSKGILDWTHEVLRVDRRHS